MVAQSKKKSSKSSNASASAFGWDFQRNAAIFLMLKNIKAAKSVRVEGEIEDIEIELDNGKVIYSQAKSISNINVKSTHISDNLKASLKTLSNASKQKNVDKLIYITNHSNPLSDSTIRYLFEGGFSQYSFSELSKKCQDKIKKILEKNKFSMNTKNLYICVLPFYGNDADTKYKYIKNEVGKFLNNCNINDNGAPDRILGMWQNDFFNNATNNNLKIKIDKKDMIWTIIVDLCSFNKDRKNDILEECNSAMIREIERKYSTIIKNNSEDFQFLNKVIADYNNYEKNLGENTRTKKFINEKYKDYENHFGLDNIDSNIRDCLIKLILSKIIDIKYTTEEIKQGAGL